MFSHPTRKITFLLTLAVLLIATTAQAHKIKIFAMAEGAVVNGYAYAPGGVRLPHDKVEVFDGNKQKLGEVETDANGAFSFSPSKRSDLHFEMDTGDGHRTSFVVHASELPDSLPTDLTGAVNPPSATPPPATARPATVTASQEELVALIDVTVARNIRSLREQIESYEEKVRFHDIMGGIGYIMGLAGIAAYLLAGKKNDGSK